MILFKEKKILNLQGNRFIAEKELRIQVKKANKSVDMLNDVLQEQGVSSLILLI